MKKNSIAFFSVGMYCFISDCRSVWQERPVGPRPS